MKVDERCETINGRDWERENEWAWVRKIKIDSVWCEKGNRIKESELLEKKVIKF